MSWQFDDMATLKGINPRQEGSGDNAEPALDLDFQASVGPHELRAALGATTDREVQAAFWTGSWSEPDKLALRFPGLGQVKIPDREFDGLMANIYGVRLTGAKAHKFSFVPEKDGNATMAFQVSVVRPPAQALAIFHEHLKTAIPVFLTPQQPDLPIGQSEEGPAEAEGAAWAK